MLSTISNELSRNSLASRYQASLLLATLSCLGNRYRRRAPAGSVTGSGLQVGSCGSFSEASSSYGSLDASGWCSGAPRGCGPMPILLTRRDSSSWHSPRPIQVSNSHSSDNCTKVDISVEEAFFPSGAFTSDGSRLVLVDSASRTTLIYDQEGRYQGSMPDLIDIGSVTGAFRAVQGSDGVLYAQYGEGTLAALDNGFRPIDTFDISHPLEGGRKINLALKSWTPSPHSSILGCADLEIGNSWEGAIVALNLQDLRVRVIQSVPYGLARWSYCALALPLFAYIGDQPYQLDWWRGGGILKIAQPSHKGIPLENFPAKLRQMPELPSISSAPDYVRAYSIIERSSMVTGLFSWEGSLFVLRKESETGQNKWSILELDAADGTILHEWRIHSTAAHMSVVPGRETGR